MSKIKCCIIAFVLFAGIIQSVSAQTPSILLLTSDSSYRQSSALVQVNGSGMLGSNSLDNHFFKKSILGGHLEADHLNKLYDEMNTLNRAGFNVNGGLDLYNFLDTIFKRPDWGLRAGFSTNYHAFLRFNRDLYKTIYMGNKSFADQTVELGPLAAGYQSWQKFGVGIFNKKTWSSLSLSLVAGQQYQSLIVNDAALYTSATGDSLSLSYQGDYLRSDSLRKGFANGSGLGLALDFDFNLPMQDQKGVISISIRDIGFIAWNKQSQRFNFDSLTTWTGVEVNNLFQLDTDTLDLPNLKDTLNFTRKNERFAATLPASVHMRYSRFFATKHLYEAGISIWPNRAAVPMVYAGASHFISDHFLISERISYGGYGKFGVGVEAQWMPYGSWLIRVGTNNAEGFISKNTYSTSAYFTLGKFFGRVKEDEPKALD